MSQHKARTQAKDETLQEVAATVEQLAQRAYVGFVVNFIRTDAAHSFIDSVRDLEVKKQLLMGGDRTINGALNQVTCAETSDGGA